MKGRKRVIDERFVIDERDDEIKLKQTEIVEEQSNPFQSSGCHRRCSNRSPASETLMSFTKLERQQAAKGGARQETDNLGQISAL